MNNDVKIGDQNPVSGSQVQPLVPVGLPNKEIAGVASPVSEFVTRSGAEAIPNIPREASAHIEVINDNPNLTPEHRELGVDHAGPNVLVPTSPSEKITLPMSEEDMAKLEAGQDDDSGKGLLILIKKTIKRAMRLS